MKLSAGLTLVYFGIAFTLAAALTMLMLFGFVEKPTPDTPRSVALLCAFSPLLTGLPYGFRVAYVARRDSLRLGQALKRGLFL